MTIYEEMVKANVQIDSHYSDLYVPVTADTTAILSRYPDKKATQFINQRGMRLGSHEHWYDIPFAFDPWWKAYRANYRKGGAA